MPSQYLPKAFTTFSFYLYILLAFFPPVTVCHSFSERKLNCIASTFTNARNLCNNFAPLYALHLLFLGFSALAHSFAMYPTFLFDPTHVDKVRTTLIVLTGRYHLCTYFRGSSCVSWFHCHYYFFPGNLCNGSLHHISYCHMMPIILFIHDFRNFHEVALSLLNTSCCSYQPTQNQSPLYSISAHAVCYFPLFLLFKPCVCSTQL